ncbi:VanZ family protein [Leptospira ognonensis]|uniref:VanZ family protein n=1 Tax=Leptospira ognonensis TaxID=2484945 RepID=A0A4R9K830_9LEPT|nr:VanZ family protein [Leptospira ognonensis]TGL61812.1 VanZ family protein [Leptospira ognonensis]
MNSKSPFPFDPFQDSLLGEKICFVWTSLHHSQKDLMDSLLSNTNQTAFYFTPNATKQTLMVSYPSKIREFLSKGEYQKIEEILLALAKGSLTENKLSALDITLELLEWLLTGFDVDEQIVIFFNSLFAQPQIIDLSFVEMVRAEYVKELRG